MTKIPIGTMVRANSGKAIGRLEKLLPLGFECYQYHWWAGLRGENLSELAKKTRDLLAGWKDRQDDRNYPDQSGLNEHNSTPFISALALYGNPLRNDSEGDEARDSLRRLIRHSGDFNCRIVGAFTGRIPGTPWEESLPVFTRVFEEISREAADYGVQIAFENCPMDGNLTTGDWNLAFNPLSWERLFNAIPGRYQEVLGLEWEPAHQITQGQEPVPQLKKWANRIFHVHGKDARSISPDRHTLPGNGDSNWTEIIAILNSAGYTGSIDIEGYHDIDWSGNRELEGQKRALDYLHRCQKNMEGEQ